VVSSTHDARRASSSPTCTTDSMKGSPVGPFRVPVSTARFRCPASQYSWTMYLHVMSAGSRCQTSAIHHVSVILETWCSG
jgi:hypothetical protein